MTKQRKRLLILVGVCAAAFLLVVAGGYFLLVSPKASKASQLRQQVDAMQSKLSAALAAAHQPTTGSSGDAPEVFRLTKAMPDRVDIAGALLDLDATARATGVVLDGITPSVPAPGTSGYESVPVQAVLHGRYGQFTTFLGRLKTLVAVRDGKVTANGRLFGVDSIQFAAGDAGLPQLKATVQLEVYVYTPTSSTPSSSTPSSSTSSGSLSATGATG